MAGKPVKIGHSPRYCDCRILVPMPFSAALPMRRRRTELLLHKSGDLDKWIQTIDTFGRKVMMTAIHQILKSPTLT